MSLTNRQVEEACILVALRREKQLPEQVLSGAFINVLKILCHDVSIRFIITPCLCNGLRVFRVHRIIKAGCKSWLAEIPQLTSKAWSLHHVGGILRGAFEEQSTALKPQLLVLTLTLSKLGPFRHETKRFPVLLASCVEHEYGIIQTLAMAQCHF